MKYFKTFESFDHNKFKSALEYDLADSRRFMVSHIPSIISIAMNKSGATELTDEMVQDFIDSVNDHVFGGIEPEEWPEAWYSFWDGLTKDSFLYANQDQRLQINKDRNTWGYFGGACPYQDKTHPYLSWSVDMSEKFKAELAPIKDMLLYIEY